MQARSLCICRGSGKCFVLFQLNDFSDKHRLTVESTLPTNAQVPCAAYEFTEGSDNGPCYVVVVPILHTQRCTLLLNETTEGGEILASVPFTLNFSSAKWQSRFNYKTRSTLCKKIRNYDETGQYDRAFVKFRDCIEDGDEVILRCTVTMPYRDDNDLSFSCLAADLSPIDIHPIVIDDIEVPLWFSPNKHRREIQLSLRLPNVIQPFIFLLEDTNHPSLANFDVLDGPMFADLRFATSNRMRPVSSDRAGYEKWFQNNRVEESVLAKQREVSFQLAPSFGIVVPLYKTPLVLFNDMCRSVMQQSYANWQLVLVNASPEDEGLASAVNKVCVEDSRITCVTLDRNYGISLNTRRGIEACTGDFVCFLDHDDLLEPNALFEYAAAIYEKDDIDLIYSDEDKMTPRGKLTDPFFKPDFSIDLLRNVNYICHFLSIRATLLSTLEPSDAELDGAQDHDLTFKAIEGARRIHHVPKILYHWRMAESSTAFDPSSKAYASEAGIHAVQNHLDRMGIAAKVSASRQPFSYRVSYEVPSSHPLVSIIIPSMDHVKTLDACVRSILSKSTYDNYEILIIENNSTEPATFVYYDRLEAENPGVVRVERWPSEFNFSKLMNFGAQKAKGDYLLLLNNDTKVITSSWIEEMLGICARKDVGVVGARLFYIDNTIQHAGVAVTGLAAGHLCTSLPHGNWGYYDLCDRNQDLSAITAACMMTKRSVFEAVGGFREVFSVAFNDVDYCLKVREKGLLVVYTPEAELYHYESLSRGYEVGNEKKVRFHREASLLNYLWAKYYVQGDPYINVNIAPGNGYYQVHIS